MFYFGRYFCLTKRFVILLIHEPSYVTPLSNFVLSLSSKTSQLEVGPRFIVFHPRVDKASHSEAFSTRNAEHLRRTTYEGHSYTCSRVHISFFFFPQYSLRGFFFLAMRFICNFFSSISGYSTHQFTNLTRHAQFWYPRVSNDHNWSVRNKARSNVKTIIGSARVLLEPISVSHPHRIQIFPLTIFFKGLKKRESWN